MPLNMLNTLNTLNILDGVGQWLVHTVGWLSIELLVFACVVYAITRSDLVRSSRVKRWLWTLVLVKPLVAAALGWPLHLATDSRADIAPMAAASVQAVVQPASGNPPLAAPADGTTAALDPASATTLHHTVRRDVGPRLSGFAVLAMLWIGGVASMAGYTVLGALWLGRVRRLAMPLEWADIAASCHEHAPAVQTLMARVDVRLTTRINEPCVYGFFRPSILVPAWCIEDDAPPNLAYILLHEGAHCRARDHWLLWFRRAMETFLWFHPVVWFAGQKAMAEAENVCDEAVVARAKADGTPSAALLYSSCLMRVLERATRHQFEAFVPGVIPTAERIRRLVQQRPTFGVLPSPAAWLAVAAFAVAALPGVLTARSAFATRAVESFLTGRPEVVRDIVYASKLPGDYFFNLYLVRSDGSGLIRLTDDRAEYGHPQWSPSGDRIAAQSRPHRNTHWGVYILDADGARLQRIGGPVTHDRPSWSPDGSRLATGVHGDESGDAHRNIYVSTVDGTESHRITDDLADYARAAWSPEGRDIALVRRAPGRLKWELALIAADGSDLRIIADASARGVQMSAPAWSPDGGRLAYLAYSGGSQDPCELRILDLGTLESTVVGVTSPGGPDFVSHLTWSPEEDYLVIADRRLGDTRNRLYRVSLATGETVALTSPIALARTPDVGPLARHRDASSAWRDRDQVTGPLRHPITGHIYYSVVGAARVDWVQARSQAALRVHDGQRGYLAVVTSEEESTFLKSQFPGTHHGFWLGGHGVATHGDAREYSWSWENGEAWDYTAWPSAGPPGPSDDHWQAGVLTWSYDPARPAMARSKPAYGWTGRGISSAEFGYVVEFDPVAVATATSR